MPGEVVEKLKSLGLSTYEAEAYHVLLRLGPVDAGVVAHKATIPVGRVYDVLNSLVDRDLAQVRDGRPKLYVPLEPRIGLANLLSARKRDLDERYSSLTQLASEVETELRVHVKNKASAFYAVAIGEADGRAFLTAKVAGAREEICVALEFKRYDPADEALFEAFDAAVRRGVKVKVLVRDADVPLVLESPYNELIARTMVPHLGTSLAVRVTTGDSVPFGVIDGEKALVGVRNPLDPAAYFALVFLWDPPFGRDLRARFGELWKQAEVDVPATGEYGGPRSRAATE